jgi:hypothetical protein
MNDYNAPDLLAFAASEAKEAYNYNSSKPKGFRVSRAGLPLLQLFVEDKLLPELPETVTKSSRPDLPSAMNIAVGYLFESAVFVKLKHQYPKATIHKNFDLQYHGIGGHCDFLVRDDTTKSVLIVECKAIRTFSKQEAEEEKLLVDNYGYFTQLSLYLAAAKELFPDYSVSGEWHVWAKPKDLSFVVEYPGSVFDAIEVAYAAVEKQKHYETACSLYEQEQFKAAADYLLNNTEPLPRKQIKFGTYCGSCSLHFVPVSKLLVDNTGKIVKNIKRNLQLLMIAAKVKNDKAIDVITKQTIGANT